MPAHMLDLLTQSSDYLHAMLAAISDNLWLSIVFIFLVSVGEAIFVVGILVPSLPILLFAGGLIASGHLPFWPIFLATALGAVVGDANSYVGGYLLRDRIKTIGPFPNYLPLIARGERFFQRHGAAAMIIGRFVSGVKAVIPGIAGMLGMPYRLFIIVNFISSVLWAGAHLVAGMLLSDWLESIGLSLELVIIVAAIVVVALLILLHSWKRVLLLCAPFLGGFGRGIAARWRKPDLP
jgi:undecaprenyl-diphosphatase